LYPLAFTKNSRMAKGVVARRVSSGGCGVYTGFPVERLTFGTTDLHRLNYPAEPA